MAIVSPLFVASVASLTLVMNTKGATINLLQQMKIFPSSGACNSPSGSYKTDGLYPQAGNYNLEEYMNLFLWMEGQKLIGNDPFLALVADDNNVETLTEAVKA